MSKPSLDIVSGPSDDLQRLGRAWINEKDGNIHLTVNLNSMPLPGQTASLVNTDNNELGAMADEYNLVVPVKTSTKKNPDKKTYYHPVGTITRVPGDGGIAFHLNLASMPMTGDLVAFKKDR